METTSSGILHQKYVTLSLSIAQMDLQKYFHRFIPTRNSSQSFAAVQSQFNVSLVLCFSLLLYHFVTLHLLFFQWEVSVSCADVQHLKVGQVRKRAFIHRVHRQAIEPKKDAFNVWSPFKCCGRNTGDAVTLQVQVLQSLRQVRWDV